MIPIGSSVDHGTEWISLSAGAVATLQDLQAPDPLSHETNPESPPPAQYWLLRSGR